ncbi:hypothetical protein [Pseudooceanicola onchidii]|uniref:hypothetical protein n=1 Tax=Pseudooceanicola onchidii TaxID=2562279 RepID=UPI0010AA8BE8|nr:hypothetical protein [Pseudooceanicola onchidii]
MTRLILGSLAALSLTASVASAQTAGRCSLVGQMAGSVWLEMIQALGGTDTAKVDSAIARLDGLTATYARLECDQAALNTAFDCVLTEDPDAAPRALLRRCMADAGIAGE